jgi:maltose alpha-D-glucosyltransferase/alpha-amylase
MGGVVDGERLRLRIDQLVRQIPPVYFQSKRWFGSKTRKITGYRVVDFDLLETEPDMFGLLLLEISYAGTESELYQVPLALKPESEVPAPIRERPTDAAFVLATPSDEIWAYDAFAEDRFCALLHEGMYDDREVQMTQGRLVFHHVPGLLDSRDVHTVRRIISEQSNTSVIFDDALILKTFRRLSAGLNPEFEVPYFLTTHTDFDYVPKVAGFIEYRHAGTRQISMGVLQDFVANQGDGYTTTLNRVRDYFDKVLRFIEERPNYPAHERTQLALRCSGGTHEEAHRLGQITGLMHNALASNSELPDFRPEPVTRPEVR